MSWTTIILGVDGTAASVSAARLAMDVARLSGARVIPVYASGDYYRLLGIYGIGGGASWLADDAEATDRALVRQSLRAHVPAEVLAALEIHAGRPAAVLADAARRLDAGLIVVGAPARRHGLGRLSDDTVHHLVRSARVPLLVAGPDEHPDIELARETAAEIGAA